MNSTGKMASKKLIVAITGATGTILGVRLLESLRAADVETHLVLSKWGARTLAHETRHSPRELAALATRSYSPEDQGASLSSGSFLTDGMIVVPCSMKTLSRIATGAADSLIQRAADVTLKEQRKLVLVVRESPFSAIHLQNMLTLSRMGVVIFPPVPAFYNHPETLEDMIQHIVMRILDQFSIHLDHGKRWEGDLSSGRDPLSAKA